MTRNKKKLILLGAILFLVIIINTPLNKIAKLSSPYDTPITQESILNVTEINDFLEVWSKLVKKGLLQSMKQVSLNKNSQVSPSIVRWLDYEGWNVERFFAVEQKLRFLISVSALANSLEDNINLQKRASGADVSAIIADQKRRLEALSYNPQELELVRANLYQISSIIEGKAVIE